MGDQAQYPIVECVSGGKRRVLWRRVTDSLVVSHEKAIASHYMHIKRSTKALINGLRYKARESPPPTFVDGCLANVVRSDSSWWAVSDVVL